MNMQKSGTFCDWSYCAVHLKSFLLLKLERTNHVLDLLQNYQNDGTIFISFS